MLLFFAAVSFAAFVELSAPVGMLILEYHKVNDHDDDAYTVPPDEFAAQLDELKRQGYETVSILDFLRAKKGKQTLPEHPVVVSFDDGYEDSYKVALPILEERKMKATVFMVTNDIGFAGYLKWDELRDMAKRGIEIGSHTANHLPLTSIAPDKAEDEIKLSKLIMEWNKLPTVFCFSYPNGEYSGEIAKTLKKNDYLAAVTGEAGLNTFSTNPYFLRRTNIPRPKLGIWEFRARLFKAKAFAILGINRHDDE